MDVTDKIAVVTGASSGLGRRFALDLAAAGATVVAMARRPDLLAEVAQQCAEASPQSEARVCDVSDTAAFEAQLTEVAVAHGRIDILLNNAGVSERVLLESQDVDHYRRLLETNFFSAVAGTLAVLPGMIERGSGVIVNVSSDAARTAAAPYGAYSASKAALSAFSEAVGHDVARHGVHVHALYPAWVPTTAMGAGAGEAGGRPPPKFTMRTEEQVSKLLLRKMGGPAIEINALRAAVFAPVVRALAPRFYRRQVAGRS